MPSCRQCVGKDQGKFDKIPQLAFELGERKQGYVIILPVVIGCLGGGMKPAGKQIEKIIQPLCIQASAEGVFI